MVHAMQDDAHSLPSSNERRNTDHEANRRENSPAPTSVAESNEDSGDETTYNSTDAQTTGENDARPVAVADSPADEVGMGLMAKRPFNGSDNGCESSWMCGIGKGVEKGRPFLSREVELARRAVGNIGGNDAGDFLTKRLYRNYPCN